MNRPVGTGPTAEFIPFVRRRRHTELNEFRSTTRLSTHGRQPRRELSSTTRVAQVTFSSSGAAVSRSLRPPYRRTEFIPFVRRHRHTERNEFRSKTWQSTQGRQPRRELSSTTWVAPVAVSPSDAAVSRSFLSLHRVARPLTVGCRRHRKRHHRRPRCLSRHFCHQGAW